MLPRFLPALFVTVSLAALPSVAAAGLAVGPSAPFDPVKIRAVKSQEGVAAAANDSLTLFAWIDLRSTEAEIFGARVRHDGTVLDPNGILLSDAVNLPPLGRPAVSWNGSEWLVAWADGQTLTATRVATDGEVLDPQGIEIATSPFFLAGISAAGLGPYHVLAYRHSDTSPRISFAVVSSDGSVEGPIDLSEGVFSLDTSPSIAVSGTTGLCAFASSRNLSDNTIRAFRFGLSTGGPPTLVRLDATDLDVSPGGVREGGPAVGASGNGWLVAWMDDRNVTSGLDIFAARVSAGGTLQDPNGIEISDDPGTQSATAVHHNGNEWLVAWSQEDFGQFLRAVANNGNPDNQRIDISTASGALGEAAFGGDADKPILAWSDPEIGTSAPKPPQDLLGRLVAQDLSLETPFVIATQTPNQTQPALAFGSNRWFVAWVDDRYGPTEGRLRYFVSDSDRFEAPDPASIAFAVERPGLDQQQPTACFDGTNFNLFWTEERGGRRQVFGARFTAGGAFIDSFAVTSGAWDHREPTCTRQTGAELIVAWTDARLPGDLDIWGQQILHGAVFEGEVEFAGADGVHEERPNFPARIIDWGEERTFLVYQRRGVGQGVGGAIRGRFIFTFNTPMSTGSERFITQDDTRVYEAPRVAWNGENWLVTYHEVVENDGPELYIPWANWVGLSFGSSAVSDPDSMGPGSYVPANPIPGSTGHNFLTLWSQLGSQVDLYLRRAGGQDDYLEPAIQYTADAAVDVPGAALGQGDRVGFAWLKRQTDVEWDGLRLFGGEAQDTLVGRIVINEFLANPPMADPPTDNDEFIELHNVSGQTFNLEGWFIVVDDDTTELQPCAGKGAPDPGPGEFRKGDGSSLLGEVPCYEFPDASYHEDSFDLDGITGSPTEGKLPNRGASLQLIAPSGVLVDQVAYGFKGGAPVSPAIPTAQAPAARAGRMPLATEGIDVKAFAPGDSVPISTARLPNGSDTDGDAEDFNLTSNPTPNDANQGTEAALGTSLFVTRVSWNPVSGPDAIELFNPTVDTFDFSNWYVGSNDGTQRIGVPGNAWSVLGSLDKRVLRRGELGSFTTDLDYLTVVYLLDPSFQRVEQIGWSRPDNQQPQLCLKREPDTGGFHNGFDWFSSGGEQNLFAGQVRYVTCDISAPDGGVPVEDGPVALAFRGAVPNPLPAGVGALVFSVPGMSGGAKAQVRLRLIDVAGRTRATLVDGPLGPGEHRVALGGAAAGIYYAELEIEGHRLSRPVVVVP